jgi:hypothetical protein
VLACRRRGRATAGSRALLRHARRSRGSPVRVRVRVRVRGRVRVRV